MTWRPALWLVAIAVAVIDQLTKVWALAVLEPGQKHQIIGDLLSFQLVFNSGAAFSLGSNTTWIMTIVAALVTVGIVYFGRRAQSRAAVLLFGVGLGGAVGNLIDRLFRQPSFGQGHVVDMINYNNWFVGNVADLAIVGVAVALLIMSFQGKTILAPTPVDAWADEEDSAEPSQGAPEEPGDSVAGASASAQKTPPSADEPRD